MVLAERDARVQRQGHFFKESVALGGRSYSFFSEIWHADYLNGSNFIKTWLHLQSII